jgi:hypothetical protein
VSRLRTALITAAAAALVAAFPASHPTATAAEGQAQLLLDAHQLKPGDRGYGLTVFSGMRPERFEVEVLGVLTNFLPNQDLILVKTQHPRLQVAKVVAGMSGSPVFVGGKMIGAYAYGWQFGEESVAGVTPISSMIAELRRPVPRDLLRPLPPAGPAPRAQPVPHAQRRGHLFKGAPLRYDLAQHASQVASASTPHNIGPRDGVSAVPVGTPLMVGGLGESSVNMLRQSLSPLGMEPIQGGGSGAGRTLEGDLDRYVDGGAIGVQLIRGDVSATGMGTVTHVVGDRLLAFGHPMMNAGVSRLPTALARVHWVLASAMRSFKIGAPVKPLGSLINDRQAAIVVDSTVEAPVIPLTINMQGIDGAPHPRWNLEIAHEPFMAPMFTAIAIGNAVDATTRENRDISWQAYTTIRVREYGDLTMHDFGVAVGGTPNAGAFMQSRAVGAMGALLNNPWEPVQIECVDMRMEVRFARDMYRLRGAEPLDPAIAPGQKARIRVFLEPYAGPMQTRIIEVAVPRELAGSTVEIHLNPGDEEVPPVAQPESVRDLMRALPKLSYPPTTIVAAVRVGGHGVAYHGQVAARLPPGALDTLRSVHSTVSPNPVPSYERTIVPLGQFVLGSTSVRVRVRHVLR